MTAPRMFIFIGRSGCGKGTQAALLLAALAKRPDANPQLYIETGKNFRAVAAGQSWTSQAIKQVLDTGGLLPDFLAVWNWSRVLAEQYTGREDTVFDGVARRLDEAKMFTAACQFYRWDKPTVIHLKVSSDWSRARLEARGRSDDRNKEDLEQRLHWFDTEVEPALDYLKAQSVYRFAEIDGERTIEVIQQEIQKLI